MADQAPGAAPLRLPLQDKRVLLVEDESIVLMFIEDLLIELGAVEVVTAMRLAEAKLVAGAAEVDVAVLDVNLAGEPSYPVAEILRGRGVPFLFASGYGPMGHSDGWRATPTVAKPIEVDKLVAAFERLLGGDGGRVGA